MVRFILMKLKDLISELEEKEFFKKFKSENPKIVFTAAFLTFNLSDESEKIQLDYFLPGMNRIAGAEFPFKEFRIYEDKIEKAKEQGIDLALDIDDLKDFVLDAMKGKEVKIRPTKIIAVLQNDVWNLTAMDDFLGIIQIKVDAKNVKMISFRRESLIDFMGVQKKIILKTSYI